MKLSIIILTNGKDNIITRCLTSIFEKTSKLTLEQIEILIGYNGKNDIIFNTLNNFNSCVKCIKHDEYQFSANCNDLAKRATGDVLLFLNDDVELLDDVITYALNILEDDVEDKIGAIGLKLLYPNGNIQHYGHRLMISNTGDFLGINHYLLNNKNINTSDIYAVGVTGAFLMIKTKIFKQFGMFNEKYKKCFEDAELCLKLTSHNKLNICIGVSHAIHYESFTRKSSVVNNNISCDENESDKIKKLKNADKYVLPDDKTLIRDYYNNNKYNILKNKILYGNTILTFKPKK